MIFLCGIPSEQSLGLVIAELEKLGAPHVVFNQRRFAGMEIELELAGGEVGGRMLFEGRRHRLEDFRAVFTRLMDHRLLPEVESRSEDDPLRLYCQWLHSTLTQWYELAPGRVLNRSQEVGLNYSKPLQAQVIRRHGFAVPETLVTNDPDLVRAFRERHGEVIYKSVSYVRSVVRLLDGDGMRRLGAIRACPTQFQAFVPGHNLRVHTIGGGNGDGGSGGGEVFATKISATAVDYRYAYEEGEAETLEATDLDDDVARRCLELAAAIGLEFAGIDLKVTPDGEVYCLEVNPAPAYSYYQLHTGQPIARAVAAYLAGQEA